MKRIDKLIKLNNKIEGEIKLIKNSCHHTKYKVELHSDNRGWFDLGRTCIDCYSFVIGLTKEEEEEYYTEQHEIKNKCLENGVQFIQGSASRIYDYMHVEDGKKIPIEMDVSTHSVGLDLVAIKPSRKPLI